MLQQYFSFFTLLSMIIPEKTETIKAELREASTEYSNRFSINR
ncbi:hypothetical protein SAMN06296273_1555 [Nitrosomonas ureae]|uniref:Uncharacterized protein n=1 Tax=Nitrosomonas ureae TaxID=44577 RepID=A0A285BYX7_9PROT|nr:hypothetical protein SAMN06296273_1555 [Nitrosomonas ureae]